MHPSTHHLDVMLRNTDTALQRLVGVIRRRDFRIVSLSAAEEHPGDLRVRVVVAGARSADSLVKHLANLVDVHSAAAEAGGPPSPGHVTELLDAVDPPRLR